MEADGVVTPFPIQAATLPDALAGRDVLGRGRTGSGKTLAFGLPMLVHLSGGRSAPGRPRGIVLVPTRELAQQVAGALITYARVVGVRLATVVGGVPYRRQIEALRRGVDLLVATPGRLTDLVERHECSLSEVAVTVLDEADQMADMGFMPQVTQILDLVPGGQRMLFSATLDAQVDRLVRQYLHDPVTHAVDPMAATVNTMTHHLLHVARPDKFPSATQIAARDGRVIMFIGTKHRADRLADELRAAGISAAALHGGKSQPQRMRTLDQFKKGLITALIATDVAARGIHIDDLDLVVNVDPPNDARDYLHRGGRTARAGKTGTVVTLVLPEQRRTMHRMMSVAGVRAESTRVAPGAPELAEITGARTPSGIPVPELTTPPQRNPRRRFGHESPRSHEDRRRPVQGRRGPARTTREGSFR
ncbi:DEAD/DEAH box helicase [Virgisporangium aliadipatigenens]|uniref:DEAD/DEAH box helicase n=1 Tax=Virgisporangium aliadipatigenens TaxID=741659 RepID=UPI001EF1EA09